MTKALDTTAALYATKLKERLGDREWRMDNLYYIWDQDANKVLFKRNESQMLFWEAMWYLNIILKDRQRGFSTLIAIFIFDQCFFNSGIQAGIIDIKIGDATKKLDKIRFAYESLPPYIQNQNPLVKDNAESLEFANGSSVSVGTSHRGGTLQILHVSELGKIAVRFSERAREIRTGGFNTVKAGNYIFIESTAEGNAGEFYDYCQLARNLADAGRRLTKLDFKFHFFGWWQGTVNEIDPTDVPILPEHDKYFAKLEKEIGFKLIDRKKAWYVKKEAQQKDDMKREFPGTPDEAFESANKGVYLQKVLNKMTRKKQITRIPVNAAFTLNTGWDYGLSDHMTIWIHQRIEFQDVLVGYMSGADDDVLYYWRVLQEEYDGVWGYHFLPHDFGHRRGGTAKDSASPPKTLEMILNDAGMRDTWIIPRIDDKRAAISEVRSWLPGSLMDEVECAEGLKCLRNFSREWDDLNGCWKERPKHNWAMHGYDGLETLVRGLNAYGCKAAIGANNSKKKSRRKPINWRTA